MSVSAQRFFICRFQHEDFLYVGFSTKIFYMSVSARRFFICRFQHKDFLYVGFSTKIFYMLVSAQRFFICRFQHKDFVTECKNTTTVHSFSDHLCGDEILFIGKEIKCRVCNTYMEKRSGSESDG